MNYERSKNREKSKEKYLEIKKKAKKAVYQAKYKTERKRFGNVMQRNDQDFKISRMVKTNQYVIGEECIRNDNDVLTVSNKDNKIAWKSHYEKLLNIESSWDRNDFS